MSTASSSSSETPFLDKLKSATKRVSGIYVFKHFLTQEQAQSTFRVINSDADFPWDLKPKLYGERLSQHAYLYKRYNKKKAAKKREQFSGLAILEELTTLIEKEFDGKVEEVWCNRFQQNSHGIPWHHDTYGQHIFVLSLGAPRKVQFRNDKTGNIDTLEPNSGDLYFFPLRTNDTHLHRVCSGTGTRLSFVFFFKPPNYAKEFKITRMDKLKGHLNGLVEAVGP